jgi:glucoamylase
MSITQGKRQNIARGGPGIEPRWTRGAKDGVGTAYSAACHVWYTISSGCLNEVYFPTIDEPQIRDLQFLVSDGKSFFHDERRNMQSRITRIADAALGFKIVNSDPNGRYAITKRIIGDPHLSCVLINSEISGDSVLLRGLDLYVLCAPHLEIGGWHNNGEVFEIAGRKILTACKGNTWLALAATVPFVKCSCGYVGVNDGWTDISRDYSMDWQYDYAPDGNVALTGKLDISKRKEFTIGLAFGSSGHDAINTLLQSLSVPFETACQTFVSQWARSKKRMTSFPARMMDNNNLLACSVNLLLTHEDKEYPGAMIASLSIPWGEDKGDEELGGYHLVWTRDMVQSATALLAADDTSTPMRALIYLAVSQREDGGFYQNFWIDGRPYWTGLQLDEVSFPIILAWRLWKLDALHGFDPVSMVRRAAGFLIREGPASPQERWEEAAGLSPSTLAANIAALVCAGEFLRAGGDEAGAQYVEEYADFLESHVEAWTVTTQGTLYPGITRHYIRITPPTSSDLHFHNEDPNVGVLRLANQAPWERSEFAAKEIVDAGFLELVRYGIRKAGDPTIEDTLVIIDALLKVDTPVGPCWKRYNHDGYGQRSDGSSYQRFGKGRPWPLLTGERGHYELAAGRPVEPYLKALEGFAHGAGLLPEQIWDEADIPEKYMFFGKPTGAAIPLLWAHAEYVKLLRSSVQGRVFDLIQPVADRYLKPRTKLPLEVWKFHRQVRKIRPGSLLRVLGRSSFMLRWTSDNWGTATNTDSKGTSLGSNYVDLQTAKGQSGAICFTFYWKERNEWEGKDFRVELG